MRLTWLRAGVLYFLYAVVVLAPMWSARVWPVWDGLDFNYPAFSFAAEALRSGRLPLWDPYTNCGMPFHADPQYAWYQPAAAFAALVLKHPFDGYMLFWTSTWVWGGLGTLLFASVLGATPTGGIIAAISFSLSGFFIGHGEHLPYVVTGCWVPWVLAFAHRAVRDASWRDALLTGASMGLSALGGYAGLVIFEGVALATWLVLAFLINPQPDTANTKTAPSFRMRAIWVIAVLASALVLLVLIWSPALYSFQSAADYTPLIKAPDVRLALLGDPFSFRALLSLIDPRLVVDLQEFFPADITMSDAYLGVLASPLMVIWVLRQWRSRWWFLVFVSFWFFVSLGGENSLRSLLQVAVPPMRYMHHNAMLRVLFLSPLAVGAGIGVSEVLGDLESRGRARSCISRAGRRESIGRSCG